MEGSSRRISMAILEVDIILCYPSVDDSGLNDHIV